MDYDNEPHQPPRQVTEWMELADKYKRERDAALERVRDLEVRLQTLETKDETP